MTKTLMIMRHAKSSWSDGSLRDHDRPLNKRGKRDAPKMARFLAARGFVPDLVIASTALRARTTAELFIEHCPGMDGQFSTLEDLYHAAAGVYLDVLSGLAANPGTVMMVGHNPGLESLVESLSGQWHRMPTSATAVFQVDIHDWSQVLRGNSNFQLVDVWIPREIES